MKKILGLREAIARFLVWMFIPYTKVTWWKDHSTMKYWVGFSIFRLELFRLGFTSTDIIEYLEKKHPVKEVKPWASGQQ